MKLTKRKSLAATDHRVNGVDLREEIESRAYHLWLADGCPHGKDLEHWLQAERELSDEAVAH